VKSVKCVCLEDYRNLAKKVLPLETFTYIDSGADDEVTVQNNVKAFQKIVFFPRILRDG
jgi:isopentenyl diphosphate isomerase/L-lactate dehydrogenase-like FMN-dependent dehydrogenase